jgi:hypothetical protein
MSLLHFRATERRRTLRVALSVPVTIHGKSEAGEKFCVQTHSQSVNRHGALFQLEIPIVVGQVLILVNDHTAKSVECHVVSKHRSRENKTYVGVEFAVSEMNFWNMQFPTPGARPLRRLSSSKASA